MSATATATKKDESILVRMRKNLTYQRLSLSPALARKIGIFPLVLNEVTGETEVDGCQRQAMASHEGNLGRSIRLTEQVMPGLSEALARIILVCDSRFAKKSFAEIIRMRGKVYCADGQHTLASLLGEKVSSIPVVICFSPNPLNAAKFIFATVNSNSEPQKESVRQNMLMNCSLTPEMREISDSLDKIFGKRRHDTTRATMKKVEKWLSLYLIANDILKGNRIKPKYGKRDFHKFTDDLCSGNINLDELHPIVRQMVRIVMKTWKYSEFWNVRSYSPINDPGTSHLLTPWNHDHAFTVPFAFIGQAFLDYDCSRTELTEYLEEFLHRKILKQAVENIDTGRVDPSSICKVIREDFDSYMDS